MIRRSVIALIGAGLVLGSLPAGAHNLTPPPSRVTALVASASNGSIAVNGTAAFGGQALKLIGDDAAGDMTVPVLPGPFDIVQARLGQLNAETGDLTFVFKMADLLPAAGVPEAARYSWDFGIDMGGESPVAFQVDGKYTDVLRRQSARAPSFVLRGNCTTDANNIITCVDVANLTAEMIPSDDEIFVDVPKAVLEQQVNGSINGRPLLPVSIFEGIGVHPAAYFSLSGTGDTLTWDAETNPYSVAYKLVRVSATPQSGGDTRTVGATLAADGSFAADLAGLAPGTYTVVAQACFGSNCGASTTSVTV